MAASAWLNPWSRVCQSSPSLEVVAGYLRQHLELCDGFRGVDDWSDWSVCWPRASLAEPRRSTSIITELLPVLDFLAQARDFKASLCWSQAAQSLAEFLARHPDDVDIWQELGVCWVRAEQPAPAREAFQRVCKLRPNASQGWIWLANAELLDDQFEACQKAARQALELDPNSVMAHLMLGRARQKSQQWEAAEASYSAGLRIAPDHSKLADMRADLRIQWLGQVSPRDRLDLAQKFLQERDVHLPSRPPGPGPVLVRTRPLRSGGSRAGGTARFEL